MIKKKVLLNWLPPSLEYIASPGLSVLKTMLEHKGYNVEIKYWNLSFYPILKDFFNMGEAINLTDDNKFFPFYAYLAVEHKDSVLMEKVRYEILSLKPQLHSKGISFIDEYLVKFHDSLNEFMEKELQYINFEEYLLVGFSAQFYQWIVATILAPKIRLICSDVPFLIGGFGTQKEALAFMNNFPSFDYASWGEGENSVSLLVKSLADASINDFDAQIPNIVYRKDGELKVNSLRNIYDDLDYSRFDLSDYFLQVKNVVIDREIAIPIEGSRGCSWRKCRFCFLNSGYKYRRKKRESILTEVKDQVKRYEVNRFIFLDNDIIGDDLDDFGDFLNSLIEYREENSEFTIILAEIVTRGITAEIIKKMSIAGFEAVQIGYESPSANLLHKINKKNTFASNLLFVKWAGNVGITINGANILRNLLEETDNDIKEGINNLRFLRFYISSGFIKHNYSFLSIAETSQYYRDLSKTDNLKEWDCSLIHSFLPKNYISDDDKYSLLFDFVKPTYNSLWDVFKKIEEHYINNEYGYKLIFNKGIVYYRELYNELLINEIEFEVDDSFWKILVGCNQKVLSFEELYRFIGINEIEEHTLKANIQMLKAEGLIYCTSEFEEIVSIINTDLVNIK